MRTIFWSWQSDLDARVTRNVIQFALNEAIKSLSAELEEADRPSLTSDTQGVAGTPDIVATILRKIDASSIFVGDVTPIAIAENGKACANPNVLLEMGYANKSLAETRVLQVWNTAFEGTTVDKLPFDMRGRRAPLSFHLAVGADTATLRAVREKLSKDLAVSLKLALDQLPSPPPDAVNWQPDFPGSQEVWFDPAVPQIVNNPMHGTRKVRWKSRFPGYARIIPSKWSLKADAKQSLAGYDSHPALLANADSIFSGLSRGGTMVCWPGTAEDGVYPTWALTQWFEKTGEIWGVGGGFLFERKDDRLTLATGHFYKIWLDFLRRNCQLALDCGGSLPLHVRLGIADLRDSWWPRSPFQFSDEDGYAAVEESYGYQTTLFSIEPDVLQNTAVAAFNGLASVYGMTPFTHEQLMKSSRF